MQKLLSFLLLYTLLFSCAPQQNKEQENTELNPAAEGFNIEQSDPAAIELADSVMQAMGGRKAWDNIQYLSWTFFGKRKLTWDKHQARVRIESFADSAIYILDMKSMTGKVSIKNTEITEADSLNKLLQKAKSIWINDSYWLVMPFKLKDTGVTLKYMGEDSVKTVGKCNILEMTFKQVGDTPQNKYWVYVDKKDNLVKQWAYFEDASQELPSAVWPFDNYVSIAGVKFSSNRSDGKGPSDLAIFQSLPEHVFTEF